MKTTVNSSRRGFLCKASAALAAPLAVGAASARAPGDRDSSLARLAQLEDVNAIRELTRRCVRHMNAGSLDDAAALFTKPAHAETLSAYRVAADPLGAEDTIEIAASGATATARLPCTAESETPIGPMTPLVEMARAQGGGLVRRTERGVLEGAYVRNDGHWKIEWLTFRTA